MKSQQQTTLLEVLSRQESILQDNLQRCGTLLAAHEQLVTLYRFIAQRANLVPMKQTLVSALVAQCFGPCQYELTIGVIDVLRGHLFDATSHHRRAIEFCGLANYAVQNPDSAKYWYDSLTSPAKYEEYRKKLNVMKLIAGFGDGHIELQQWYEALSSFIHPSPVALQQGKMIYDERADVTTFEWSYFQADDPNRIDSHLFTALHVHVLILDMLIDVLHAVRGDTFDARSCREQWKFALDSLVAEAKPWQAGEATDYASVFFREKGRPPEQK